MPGPPPKPKGSPNDLAEVERALSVLKGRHPEHERARREDEEARTKRQAEIDAAAHSASRVARTRYLKVGVIGIAATSVIGVIAFFANGEVSRRGRVELASAPHRANGFTLVETSSRGTPGKLEAAPEAGCLLAVSTDSAPIKVSRAGANVEGPGPVLLCACNAEPVTVTSNVAAGGGLALLRADAAALGGSRAFSFLAWKPGTFGTIDGPCAEASLDAWIDAKHAPDAKPDPAWIIADPKRAALVSVGIAPLASLKKDVPFVVADAPNESCVIAVSSIPTDKLTLRLKGGATPITNVDGAFGWCAVQGGSIVVRREGGGAVTLLSGPAARIGGLQGLGEIANAAGIPLAEIDAPQADRGWSAKQLLVASAVPESLVTVANAPELAPDADGRVVAVSFATAGALVAEPGPDVFSFCSPTLGDPKTLESTCVFSGPQTWRIGGPEAAGGLARAKLPFWLFGLQSVSEPASLKSAVELVALARRLKREGFEPTTIEAMTEQANGIEVLGRAGEDAIVAVGVAPSAPWIFTYAKDPKATWSLDGEPLVVPIKPLERVVLAATTRNVPAKNTRRSVVFRRQKR